jgi:hypothetical protein
MKRTISEDLAARPAGFERSGDRLPLPSRRRERPLGAALKP